MSESKEQILLTHPIGSRIRLADNSIGTLKYVGEVCFCVYIAIPAVS